MLLREARHLRTGQFCDGPTSSGLRRAEAGVENGAQADKDRLIGTFHGFLNGVAFAVVGRMAEFSHEARHESAGADAMAFRFVTDARRERKTERCESRLRNLLV